MGNLWLVNFYLGRLRLSFRVERYQNVFAETKLTPGYKLENQKIIGEGQADLEI